MGAAAGMVGWALAAAAMATAGLSGLCCKKKSKGTAAAKGAKDAAAGAGKSPKSGEANPRVVTALPGRLLESDLQAEDPYPYSESIRSTAQVQDHSRCPGPRSGGRHPDGRADCRRRRHYPDGSRCPVRQGHLWGQSLNASGSQAMQSSRRIRQRPSRREPRFHLQAAHQPPYRQPRSAGRLEPLSKPGHRYGLGERPWQPNAAGGGSCCVRRGPRFRLLVLDRCRQKAEKARETGDAPLPDGPGATRPRQPQTPVPRPRNSIRAPASHQSHRGGHETRPSS